MQLVPVARVVLPAHQAARADRKVMLAHQAQADLLAVMERAVRVAPLGATVRVDLRARADLQVVMARVDLLVRADPLEAMALAARVALLEAMVHRVRVARVAVMGRAGRAGRAGQVDRRVRVDRRVLPVLSLYLK